MPRSAVVDASILVSAFLFPESVPGQVFTLARRGAYVAYLSPILIEEARRSLLNPRLKGRYGHSENAVHTWLQGIEDVARMMAEPSDIQPVCRDPDDDHLIATALMAGAECIDSRTRTADWLAYRFSNSMDNSVWSEEAPS